MYGVHVGDRGSQRPGRRFQEATEARKCAAESYSLQGVPESSLPKSVKVKPNCNGDPKDIGAVRTQRGLLRKAVVTGCSWLKRIPYLLQAAGLERHGYPSLEYGIFSAWFSISLV